MAHRSTLKNKPRAHKTRHSTKGAIKAANKGRIEKSEGNGPGKHVMSKQERKNLKNQIRATKQSQLIDRNKIFDGRHGAPRNVVIVPLTSDIDSMQVAQQFSSTLGCVEEGLGIVSVPKFRQRVRFFVPKFTEFFEIMDCTRSADFVLFVLSANQEITDYGEQVVRSITMQGVSTSFGLIWGLASRNKAGSAAIDGTVREKDIRDSLTSWFSHFFTNERLYSIDSDSELAIVGRLLCQRTPKGLHWRDERPYIVVEKAEVHGPMGLVVEGNVRGQQLSPDMLMHIPTCSDFKIARIEQIGHGSETSGIWEPNEEQQLDPRRGSAVLPADQAIELHDAESEHLEGSGVRIDGHTDVSTLVNANAEDNAPKQAKNVPEGTSEYQAAWFLEGEDYRSDPEEDEEGALTDEEGELVDAAKSNQDDQAMESDAMSEDDGEEEDDGDAELDDMEDEEVSEVSGGSSSRPKDIMNQAKDDLEFPDEIELDPSESGKERLKRYRGVRDIRHNDWDPYEKDPNMPAEYPLLFRPGNLAACKNRTVKLLSEGAPLGTRVRVYLEATAKPLDGVDVNGLINRGFAFTAYGLLPGEEKLGYVSATIAMDSEVTEPIKSKQTVIVQYGARRFRVNPLFSPGGYADTNVCKLNRFLHPGRSALATFNAPVFLGNVPAVFYRTDFKDEQVILGAGSIQDCDADRVIVKKAILTGLPVKIHRRLVTIRHMFFSREDVEWFFGVPLYTKLGAQGFIKESLGTHGLFKATFDKKVPSEDTICMPLYKRVWPKQFDASNNA